MPYTPPASQSPANSLPASPPVSRSHSNKDFFSLQLKSQPQSRPGLPRSLASTQYLQKHRRSPSLTQTNEAASTQIAGGETTQADADKTGLSINGSLRQSPPPVSNTLIPPGAIMSPPESPQNGSDDENPSRGRSARVLELRDVVRDTIHVRKGQSPTRAEDREAKPLGADGPDHEASTTSSLSWEARKMARSRSSTELATVNAPSSPPNYSSGPSTDDSESDEDLISKPPMIRKKSGELVRPALRPQSRRRPSSMPGTPTYAKAVHFNEEIEQVRHFLKVDRPIAVSAGSSPVETFDNESDYPFGPEETSEASRTPEWDIRLSNFPPNTSEREHLPVRVEKILLSPDQKTLLGTVAVANLAFNKSVAARFTLDYWKTTSEVAAEFDDDARAKQADDGYDRFGFSIRLADQANLQTKTMFICVRYNVNGQEFWDSNNSANYQIDFVKTAKPQVAMQNPLGARPIGAIPRSRHSPSVSAGGRMRTSIDDSFEAFTSNRSAPAWVDDAPNTSFRLKRTPEKRGSMFPNERSNNSSQAFGNRYDFSKSLTAALTQAQQALATRRDEQEETGYFKRKHASAAPVVGRPTTNRTAAPSAALRVDARPPLDSAEYKQMLNQMCFFASGTAAPASTPSNGVEQKAVHFDGAPDERPGRSVNSHASDGIDPRSQSPRLSRSTSPGALAASSLFGYPHYQNNHFSNQRVLPAIQG